MEPDASPKKEDNVYIRSYLMNRKETYDSEYKRTGEDTRVNEIQALINSIDNSENDMVERRRQVIGFDFIYAEGKFVEMLDQVFDNYYLGNYYATIAVASMVAERLCYDFINMLEIKVGDVILNESQKGELHHLPFLKC